MIAQRNTIDATLHALADANRRAMVARLTRGPASVSELAAPLEISLPSALQHIEVLQRAELVRSDKVGRVRTCRLRPEPLRDVERWVAEQRRFWKDSLDRLGDVLDATYGGSSK